jgi:octaprenyl-diphosphate synthase
MIYARRSRLQDQAPKEIFVTPVVNIKDHRTPSTVASIDRLIGLTADDLVGVNKVILEQMQSQVLLIPQLAGHIIAAGGKRLRPMLTLATARMCGYEGDRHVGLAACVEFIHTATLLHDDVVDESDLRRGAATANAVWGNKASVLVGDFLFSRAFELMVSDGSLEVLRILSEASSVIAEGEVHQLVTANDTDTVEADYLEVIQAKTAKLFAAACEIGAVVADRPEAERMALQSFGHNIGMSFQLIDDVLDYSARQATLGKTVGDDFRDGKITLPVVLAFRAADDDDRAFWRRTLEDQEQKKGDLKRAVQMLEKTGAMAATVDRARDYAQKATSALSDLPNSEIKTSLHEAVDFAVERSF